MLNVNKSVWQRMVRKNIWYLSISLSSRNKSLLPIFTPDAENLFRLFWRIRLGSPRNWKTKNRGRLLLKIGILIVLTLPWPMQVFDKLCDKSAAIISQSLHMSNSLCVSTADRQRGSGKNWCPRNNSSYTGNEKELMSSQHYWHPDCLDSAITHAGLW